ncbi:hypothetical protein FDC45_17790 [Clostridium botulinum]|uniref:Uncharacterized protein n=1 Tax=Clostridium botulinum TaxID=1491 RepID=A0A846J8X6_CLOBO|nr:hypothetical protein [Clostridium botulinum]ACA57458.1 hypothetical protein CLK_A0246 [Clostridium botulinum A3 str. Loch Maree]NFH67021.1 hypothetical protein [Clostridium botulinum]NFJ09610.1 hypothetical protein [Clostridium botulinum]NFK16579.1 hypothetical protein [Clostridium botulinum]NFM94304.1 hypothetical protein [Clostridium botulinum]
MMKATVKFDKESQKWVIDVETEDREVIPVGHTIEESIGLFKICKWDSKEQAEEWIKARPDILTLVDKNTGNRMKVYFDGNYEWYASPWELEKTREWVIKNYQLDDDFELEKCDLDNGCMWYETTDRKDIEELSGNDEQCKGGIGDLRRGIEDKSIVEKIMTFREVLEIQGYSKEPYIIATTNC